MKRYRFFAGLALLTTVFVLPAFGQAPAAQPPSAAQATVAPRKVAVIFTGDFQDPKAGIVRFTALLTKLNAEFQAEQDALNQTAQRLKTLQDEITNLQRSANPVPPAQIRAKIDSFDTQKTAYARRGEDAQTKYQTRRAELFSPLQDDIGKALDAYAKARGIAMIIDGSQIQITYAAESIDITKAFIAEYNSKNPATTTAVTAPAPTRP